VPRWLAVFTLAMVIGLEGSSHARGAPCLSGDSTTGDARALDAVLARLETVCPCTVFDDVDGNGARAYKRCARDVLRAAVAAGELRRECRALLGRSTCGRAGRVLCCEERRTTQVRRCMVRRATGCTGTARWLRTVEEGDACAASVCLRGTSSTSTTIADTTTTTSTSTTSTTLAWSDLHSTYIGPRCGTCHGIEGEAGLIGLGTCRSAYDSLVDVPSTELPGWDRVEPGAPERSWIMQKLDGTQAAFDDSCVGGSCGDAMPLEPPPLSQEARDAIRAWIAGGAVSDCP
jgi:hypothetical protein